MTTNVLVLAASHIVEVKQMEKQAHDGAVHCRSTRIVKKESHMQTYVAEGMWLEIREIPDHEITAGGEAQIP